MKRQRRIYTAEAAVDAILEEAPPLTKPVMLTVTMGAICHIRNDQTTRHRSYVAEHESDRGSVRIAAEPTAAALRRAVLEWLRAEARRQADSAPTLSGQTALAFPEVPR